MKKESQEKTKELKKIRNAVWNLSKSPLYKYRIENKYYPVLGEGNHDAQIIFIGEAPGKNEAIEGRPFCGASGKILNELLEQAGIKRESVYITNIVKDRPPENRDPSSEEIALYAPFLEKQIEVIRPKIIATLGRFSMEYILKNYGLSGEMAPISALHGTIHKTKFLYGTVYIVPLYHPAVAIYQRSSKEILEKDFKTLKKILNEII